jgi:hypothetical protein
MFIKRVLGWLYFQSWNFGLWNPPDRKFLRKSILPRYAKRAENKNVLFVGVRRYTKNYENFFSKSKFITIDPDPKVSKFGTSHHIEDYVQNLAGYRDTLFKEGLDVVFLNGVFGYGIDKPADVANTWRELLTHTKPDAAVIVGFNPNLMDEDSIFESTVFKENFKPSDCGRRFRMPLLKNAVHEYRFFTRVT